MHGSCVLEAILPRLCQLEELYLTNNYITGVIMQRLAPALEALTCLQRLFLQQNDLGFNGALALRHSFQRMTTITLLTLDYCVLRAEGLLEIAHGLRHLTSIETLRINHNGLGLMEAQGASVQEVCEVLARSLSQMSRLKYVELAQSGFGYEETMAIAHALLKANAFANVDDVKIREVLKHLRKKEMWLAELTARRVDISDEESQPMRCMLSEVYSHNIVRHQPINKNQCAGCHSPRVSIVANFLKGKKEGVETRRASFIGEKGSYNEHVVMKTVPCVCLAAFISCTALMQQPFPHPDGLAGTRLKKKRWSEQGLIRSSTACRVFLGTTRNMEGVVCSLNCSRYLSITRKTGKRTVTRCAPHENAF
jgi:predicted CXXCH cytochrome family protein